MQPKLRLCCLALLCVASQSGRNLCATPTHIALRGSRAVVADSGNQRILKLQLQNE